MVYQPLLRDLFSAAKGRGATRNGVPIHVSQTTGLDRSLIVLAQTPQGFSYELLARAHREAADAGLVGDDDAQLVAATGHLVTVVPGEPANIKLTTPEDLEVVEALIREHETVTR